MLTGSWRRFSKAQRYPKLSEWAISGLWSPCWLKSAETKICAGIFEDYSNTLAHVRLYSERSSEFCCTASRYKRQFWHACILNFDKGDAFGCTETKVRDWTRKHLYTDFKLCFSYKTLFTLKFTAGIKAFPVPRDQNGVIVISSELQEPLVFGCGQVWEQDGIFDHSIKAFSGQTLSRDSWGLCYSQRLLESKSS